MPKPKLVGNYSHCFTAQLPLAYFLPVLRILLIALLLKLLLLIMLNISCSLGCKIAPNSATHWFSLPCRVLNFLT